MALRTRIIFFGMLGISIMLSFLFSTHSFSYIPSKNVPIIEFGNFELYKITTNGTYEAIFGSSGFLFDKKNIAYNALLYQEDKNTTYLISGKKLLITKKKISIEKEAKIHKDDYQLSGKKFIYNLKKQTIKSDGNFTLKNNTSVTNGTDLVVRVNKNTMNAKNIYSIIQTQDD